MDTRVSRALISVSDKTGIVDFAKKLRELNIEIISTGGTAKLLREEGIKVQEVSDMTKFPEILDGRVKTLHPAVYGGLLAVRNNKEHMNALAEHNIATIDIAVVNLYPFEKTISNPDVKLEDAIENIDIGGPSMIRASAKNFEYVAIVVNPLRYNEIINELKNNKRCLSHDTKSSLAIEAFSHTCGYDAAISEFLKKKLIITPVQFPETLILRFKKLQDLRYGENPHQKAAFYKEMDGKFPCIINAEQLHGKELSYNNIMDADAAINLIMEFKEPAAAIIKHANPCGVSVASDISKAYKNAYNSDPVSAFGGIIVLNRPVNKEIAKHISTQFVEIVIASAFDESSLDILKQKKNIRILKIENLGKKFLNEIYKGKMDLRKVGGGLLYQDYDSLNINIKDLKTVTRKKPTNSQYKDLLFAWKVVKHVKSNAIVIARDGIIAGVGAGQTSRVGSVKIACKSAGKYGKNTVLASDGLFPKPDNLKEAHKIGVISVIQPGGSINDKEVIETADKLGISMVFTGVRHFKH